MEIYGENRQLQGMPVKNTKNVGVEIKHKRRALGEINQNFMGARYNGVVHTKVVSGTHQNCDLDLPYPAAKPTARKFGSENLDPLAQKFTILGEDVAVMDVEEHKDQMEIDVEDKLEENVLDIDECDSENPLSVVEYVDELYAYYKRMEVYSCVSPNYMAQQGDINEKMRAILIDWLIEVHHKFDLRYEALFLTVNLIDRFLAQQGVVRKNLQLVGLVALLLACKYEEVSVPIVDDLIYVSDRAYTRGEILDTEKLMLNTLQFNMSVPTAYVFMNRYLQAAQAVRKANMKADEADKKFELLSFFLIELCLVEYDMLKYSPSFLAASAIYTAHCTLFGYKQWCKTCEWHTSYSEDQLLECSKLIVSFHKKAATGKLTGIHRKYSTSKFGFIAKVEPANFLVDTEY